MNDLRTQAYPALSMYIGGRFIGADEREGQPVINPASGKTLGKLPQATKEDLDHALAAAQTAFETWRWSNPMDRSAILRKVAGMVRERAETLAINITRDQGKPLAEARIEVAGAADHLEWHAEECRRRRAPLPHSSRPEAATRTPAPGCRHGRCACDSRSSPASPAGLQDRSGKCRDILPAAHPWRPPRQCALPPARWRRLRSAHMPGRRPDRLPTSPEPHS